MMNTDDLNPKQPSGRAAEWLCRNCNSLNAPEAPACVYCHADRPEEQTDERQPATDEQAAEGQQQTVEEHEQPIIRRESYSNPAPAAPARYTFRESVLITSADIILFVGLFCSFGALIAPAFIDGDIPNLHLYSIVGAIVFFAWAMISWALLRCVADISRRLRRNDK